MAEAYMPSQRPQPSRMYRWLVLIFISLAMFGNYYVYDSIAPIADLLKSQLGFSDVMIGRLYSVYSYAAVATLLLGGVIIDRFGTKKAVMLFGAVCTVAGVLTAISPNFYVMLAGRLLLGLGAESLIVAVTTALAKWFKGKELSFAFGINLTVARLGSVAADNSPTWAGRWYSNWHDPLWVSAVIGGFCLLGAIVYWMLESNAERKYTLGEAGSTDKLVWRDLLRFNRSFWYVVALCVTFYSAILPFRAFAIKFFQEGHGLSREAAGGLNSLLPLSAMIATPLFGLLVDRIGHRALFMAVGSLLLTPVFVMMIPALHLSLYLPIAFVGIAYSMIPAIMWPSVAYIVDERKLGTAYALMTLVQQLGVAGMNEAIGRANDVYGAGAANPSGYNPMLYTLSTLGFLGLLFSFLLWKTEKGPSAHGLETITAGAASK
ncbi:MAG TPA: MFS transporter [Clostridia bacterium]|nr:MFS transporter [Clostridia bacterium]